MPERTFLLTDVEGSTRLWEEHPVPMAEALELHDAIAARVVASFAGRLVKSRGEGDSAFAVFEETRAAVDCALELQRSLHATSWPHPATIRVRMAVHSGDAQLREGEFYGSTVNRCARLRDAAHGGQTVVSHIVRERLAQHAGNATFLDLGLHRFKDLAQPQRVWQVTAPGLPDRFPALRSLDAAGHNLPTQTTAFIGRELELDDVTKLLASARLVTLTGPGGSGKTRLAVQAAAELFDAHPDGVWFVDLSALRDPALVPDRVAAALGLRAQPGRPVAATIADSLATRNALLLLDNCEHLADACAGLIATLISECPGVRIIATSRERLRVYGESVYLVPPMETPGDERVAHLEELVSYEAVRLFCDRAALVRHGFTLTAGNADAVSAVTRGLDGIPLAIELAAGLVNDLSLSDMAARLDDRLGLLTLGPRTVDARHQTLRGALEWSHDLLPAPERLLFARLSVFAGGWSLDAAERVGGTDLDARSALTALTEKSLVTATENDGQTRYAMLETIREYAAERLAVLADPEPARVHAAWFFELAEEANRQLDGADSGTWIGTLETEHANTRAALEWGIEHDGSLAVRMAGYLAQFWQARGYLHEGHRLAADALAAFDDDSDERLGAKATQTVANLAIGLGDYDEAGTLIDRVVAFFRTIDDPVALCSPLMTHGGLAFYRGDYRAAVASFEEALGIATELGRTDLVSALLGNLASAADSQGDYVSSRSYAERAAGLAREAGNRTALVVALSAAGAAAQHLGDYEAADLALEESLVLARESGDVLRVLRLVNNLGSNAIESGRLDRARPLCEEALSLAREAGERRAIARSQMNLGALELESGRASVAAQWFEDGLAIAREIGDQAGVAAALRGLAGARRALRDDRGATTALTEALDVACSIGDKLIVAQALEELAGLALTEADADRATKMHAAAVVLHQAMGTQPGRNAPDTAALRSALGVEAFERAWDAGRSLTLEEIAALARSADRR